MNAGCRNKNKRKAGRYASSPGFPFICDRMKNEVLDPTAGRGGGTAACKAILVFLACLEVLGLGLELLGIKPGFCLLARMVYIACFFGVEFLQKAIAYDVTSCTILVLGGWKHEKKWSHTMRVYDGG